MANFDKRAKEWDNNPERVKRAKEVAEKLREKLSITPDMNAFEYGCGTGLLSFQLQQYFNKIIMADNSDGMLDVLKKKIEKQDISNMEPRFLDLTKDEILDESFDIIYTLMTLHHIQDLDQVLNKFSQMLSNNGYLCIIDLEKEDGSFHSYDFNGHNGFERNKLEKLLNEKGLKVIDYEIVYSRKKIINDEEKIFPIFLLIAKQCNKNNQE